MGLSIKNERVEVLVREMARQRKTSITDVILQSLERENARDQLLSEARGSRPSDYVRRIMEITERTAALPDINTLSDDEILGYDEFGVPTK